MHRLLVQYIERGVYCSHKIPTVCVMELFMTSNVFDCSNIVGEEDIATKENGYGGG